MHVCVCVYKTFQKCVVMPMNLPHHNLLGTSVEFLPANQLAIAMQLSCQDCMPAAKLYLCGGRETLYSYFVVLFLACCNCVLPQLQCMQLCQLVAQHSSLSLLLSLVIVLDCQLVSCRQPAYCFAIVHSYSYVANQLFYVSFLVVAIVIIMFLFT